MKNLNTIKQAAEVLDITALQSVKGGVGDPPPFGGRRGAGDPPPFGRR